MRKDDFYLLKSNTNKDDNANFIDENDIISYSK